MKTTPQPRADVEKLKQRFGSPGLETRMTDPIPRRDVCLILGLPSKCPKCGCESEQDSGTLCIRSHKGCDGIMTEVPIERYKQAVRVKIAELDGWTFIDHGDLCHTIIAPDGRKTICNVSTMNGAFELLKLPDYPNDLNACHEWEIKLEPRQVRSTYLNTLHRVCNPAPRLEEGFASVTATALQRCETWILMEGK